MSIPECIRETQLVVAQTYLGMDVTEEPLGSNLGKWVEIFQEDANLNPHDAWCMAFVYHCHLRACKMQRFEQPFLEKTGWCKGQWLYALSEPSLTVVQAPDIKDIPDGAIWIRFASNGTGHTGFVVDHNPGKKTILSLEGNASDRVKAQILKLPSIPDFKGVVF